MASAMIGSRSMASKAPQHVHSEIYPETVACLARLLLSLCMKLGPLRPKCLRSHLGQLCLRWIDHSLLSFESFSLALFEILASSLLAKQGPLPWVDLSACCFTSIASHALPPPIPFDHGARRLDSSTAVRTRKAILKGLTALPIWPLASANGIGKVVIAVQSRMPCLQLISDE